jgi:hypothetical protein
MADRQGMVAVSVRLQLRRHEDVARDFGHDLEDARVDLLDPGDLARQKSLDLDHLDHHGTRAVVIDLAVLGADGRGKRDNHRQGANTLPHRTPPCFKTLPHDLECTRLLSPRLLW